MSNTRIYFIVYIYIIVATTTHYSLLVYLLNIIYNVTRYLPELAIGIPTNLAYRYLTNTAITFTFFIQITPNFVSVLLSR